MRSGHTFGNPDRAPPILATDGQSGASLLQSFGGGHADDGWIWCAMDLGSYRVSKCTTPRLHPLTWHYYLNATHRNVVFDDLRPLFDPALNPSIVKARLADLTSLLEDAALGLLVENGDQLPNVKAVHRDPELWELRWVTEDGGCWRMYHAEPDTVPGHLVSLKAHRKDLTGTKDDIRDRQNAHIDAASERYTEGQPRSWGIN